MRKFSLVFIVFLTFFSLVVRLYRFTEPNHYYFDEVYHAVTAKGYADNNPDAYNPFSPAPKEGTAYDWLHPPLAKLIQAGSIKIFGDVPLGWRLPSVVFGTAIIPATFFLANVLFGPVVAMFAATVIAFENLTFVMSRITMNDVFVTFFSVMAFALAALYVSSGRHSEPIRSELHGRRLVSESRDSIAEFIPNKNEILCSAQNDRGEGLQNDRKEKTLYLILTAIFLGLAVGTKWTGVYAVVAVGAFILFAHLRGVFSSKTRLHLEAGKVLLKLSLLIVVPVLLYLLSYGQYWLQGHSLVQFIDLHKQIWWYQNREDLEHSYGTTPLYCVPKGLLEEKTWCPWVLNSRGVYLSYEQYGERAGYIYALGNPLVFWVGILAIAYLVGKFIEERKKEDALILLGYFIFWVPFIFTPRLLFLYHYLPSIPFLSIALGVMLATIWRSRLRFLSIIIVVIFAIAFFYFYPISSSWPIEPAAIDKYMWLKTWR